MYFLKNKKKQLTLFCCSTEVAKYYHDNRYIGHAHCSDPCSTMSVVTNLKYKIEAKPGQIVLLMPREIDVVQETLVKSFLSFGITIKHLKCNI